MLQPQRRLHGFAFQGGGSLGVGVGGDGPEEAAAAWFANLRDGTLFREFFISCPIVLGMVGACYDYFCDCIGKHVIFRATFPGVHIYCSKYVAVLLVSDF